MNAAKINAKRTGFTGSCRINSLWRPQRRRQSVSDGVVRAQASRFRRLCQGGWLLLVLAAPCADAVAGCRVVDLMPDFWQSLESDDAAARLRVKLIDPHPDLYNDTVVKLPSGAKWLDETVRERTYAEGHREELVAAEQYLSAQVEPIMAQFQRMFPDYRCDYPFYIAPTFGRMDGAATLFHGHHLIVFAPDVIPRYHRLSDLKVLVDHETFHIYHHQVTGVYGASEEAIPTIFEALWGEGLATFASWRLNPEVSLDTALLQPGIPEAAKPHLANIASELLAHLDQKDEAIFRRYFLAGRQKDGYPPRAGYYVGVLVAQALATRYTLTQLAHLNGAALHGAVVAELERIAAGVRADSGR